MANTTNFGWETPDDTDLVKDGAAAIRTLGSAIDTSLVDLKGGTTGQVLAKASNTDMDFTWATDASGIPATIFDAKGDIIAASAADTAARLAVGANNTVLTADSSTATGLKWASPSSGSLTSLATGTLSGASTTISGISGSYTHLQLVIGNYFASVDSYLGIEFNGTASVYGRTTNDTTGALNNVEIDCGVGGGMDSTAKNNMFVMNIYDYTSSNNKIGNYIAVNRRYDDTTWGFGTYMWAARITSALTSIKMITVSGGTWSGGTYTLYGVK